MISFTTFQNSLQKNKTSVLWSCTWFFFSFFSLPFNHALFSKNPNLRNKLHLIISFKLFQYPSYRGGGNKNDYNSLHRREHHHRHHHSSHRHGDDPDGKLGGGNTQFIHGQSGSDSTINSRKSIKSEERMKQKRLGLVLLLLIGALLIAFGIGLLIYFLLMESKYIIDICTSFISLNVNIKQS